MRILITGFEPFGGRSTNPTAQLIEALQRAQLKFPSLVEVKGLLLPVTFADAFQVLQKEAEAFRPDAILALGLAAGRKMIELERVAINCLDADIPDNQGSRPVDQWITPEGREAYFSTLPLRPMEQALQAAGIPVQISNSAGTYVCNYLFYKIMEEHPGKICGFVHFPLHSEITDETQQRAVEIMVEVISSVAARP